MCISKTDCPNLYGAVKADGNRRVSIASWTEERRYPFNEIVIDVNTMYFERNGGYEYAKQFYEEAYHFIEEKFGADNVISAVMHADEINVAATEELGKEVYHYHLHAMVLPVVEKEILWSKRCKNPELRGTVKEVVNQISHSKKWKSDIPMTDEKESIVKEERQADVSSFVQHTAR